MTFRPPKGTFSKKPLRFSQEPCTYTNYKCLRPCVENYSYCVFHILEDKTAPFKQCNYIYSSTNRRCTRAALKQERRESFCYEHVRKVQQKQLKQSGSPRPPMTVEKLLTNLSHHVRKQKAKDDASESNTDSSFINVELTSDNSDKESTTDAGTNRVDPFVDIEASSVNNSMHRVLEYCSESDSDVDITTLDQTSRGRDEDSSDAESIDSAGEDIFKHANIHTAEEVTSRTKEKLIRLQALYIDQFKRLKHVLRERRRDYVHGLQKEKEALCSIANQPHDTLKEKKLYEKLKGYKNYRTKNGVEALLRKKYLEKRQQTVNGIAVIKPLSSSSKCIFSEGGVKCSMKTIPSTKHCPKHILQDPFQVLFKACGANKGDTTCQEPVLHMFNAEHCVYHWALPPTNWTYNSNRLSSEEDDEESPRKLGVSEEQQKVEVKEEVIDMPQTEVINKDLEGSKLYNALQVQQSLALDMINDNVGSKIRKLLQIEELPLQIMESKDVPSEEQVYYMSGAEEVLNEETVEECPDISVT